MSRMPGKIFVRVLAALAAIAPCVAGAADLDDTAGVGAYMDGLVERMMHNNHVASGVVAISRGGETIYSKGFGFRDFDARIPADPETTMYRPGSISKLFTWTSVMQLVEQGKLDLDTDVNEYLQGFRIADTFEEPITLRHLMTHTPGFEDGALGYLIVVDEKQMIPLSEAMRRFQPERVNPPGVQTAYSNYGTALAGLIVETVSGQPYNQYVQEHIFDVLGMENSTFVEPLPPQYSDQEAIGYQAESGVYDGKPFELVGGFGPAGALSTSAADLLRFANAFLNGGELDGARILAEPTVRQMLTRNFSHDERMMGMALGFYETDENGIRIVGHGGDLFHIHSDLAIDLDHGIVIFASFTGDGGSTLRAAIVPAFYDRFFPRDEPPPVAPADFAGRAGRYAGSYLFWRSNFSNIEKLGALSGGITVAPTRDNTLLVAFAGGAKQFVEVEPNLFRELNQEVALSPRFSPRLIAFQDGADGSVTGMVMDGLPFMSLYKAPVYAGMGFNGTLLALSSLVFVGVLLRLAYQWRAFRSAAGPERSAAVASIAVAGSNLLFFIVAGLVLTIYGAELFNHIPFAFKAMLVLPMVAFAAGLYHAFKLVVVWKDGLLASRWARMRYAIVTLAALFMCWFYYFWNVLGFQTMT